MLLRIIWSGGRETRHSAGEQSGCPQEGPARADRKRVGPPKTQSDIVGVETPFASCGAEVANGFGPCTGLEDDAGLPVPRSWVMLTLGQTIPLALTLASLGSSHESLSRRCCLCSPSFGLTMYDHVLCGSVIIGHANDRGAV